MLKNVKAVSLEQSASTSIWYVVRYTNNTVNNHSKPILATRHYVIYIGFRESEPLQTSHGLFRDISHLLPAWRCCP